MRRRQTASFRRHVSFVKLRVTKAYRDRVEEIKGWCDDRRMLDLQIKLQHWLHTWLFVHAPNLVSAAELVIFWHAYVTLFNYWMPAAKVHR